MPAMINVIGDNIAAVTATNTAFRATNPAIIVGINPTSKSNGPTINANAAAIAAIIAIGDLVVFDKLLNQFASLCSHPVNTLTAVNTAVPFDIIISSTADERFSSAPWI